MTIVPQSSQTSLFCQVLSAHVENLCLFPLYRILSLCFGPACISYPTLLPLSLSSTSLLSSPSLIKHLIRGPGGWGIMRLGLYMFTHSDLHWAFAVFLCLTHISMYPYSMFLLFMSPVSLSGFLSSPLLLPCFRCSSSTRFVNQLSGILYTPHKKGFNSNSFSTVDGLIHNLSMFYEVLQLCCGLCHEHLQWNFSWWRQCH